MKKRRILLRLLLLLLVASSSSSSPTTDSDSDTESSSGSYKEWMILTKQNFSAQIRLHRHILIFATLPWSGEARSLMRDVAAAVNSRREEFVSLKLMLLYVNVDKMLADAIGASDTDETTVLFYHHSKSYKYRGRLRAQNILSSIKHYMRLPPEDIPLKHLTSPRELETFLESTDRSLLLLEFCGWTSKLLTGGQNNGTANGFGNLVEAGFTGKTNKMSETGGGSNQKGMDAKMTCSIETGFTGIPWLSDFSSVTGSSSWNLMEGIPDTRHGCSFQEFQLFESFFPTIMTLAAEFSLPPERLKFGLVSDKSLLSLIRIGEPSSWSVMMYYAGCLGCSKILKEGENLRSFLQSDISIVTELEGSNGHTSLPANKPSVLLFVDRSSDLLEDRVKSNEALDAFRGMAWQSQIPYGLHGTLHDQVGRLSVSISNPPSASGHPKLKLSTSAEKARTKDKLSIRILNDGKDVTLENINSDIRGNSLNEILAYLLQQKKEERLSSVAKEAGFELLSGDFEIKITNFPSQVEAKPKQDSEEGFYQEGLTGNFAESEQLVDVAAGLVTGKDEISGATDEEISGQMDTKPFHSNAEKTVFADGSKHVASDEHKDSVGNIGLPDSEDVTLDSSKVEELKKQQLHLQQFRDSFYFSDGDYRLLRTLTGGSEIPSLVIVDPVLQQHYLFHDKNFRFAAMADFMSGYLSGTLIPYQQSDPNIPIPRDISHPPFVNLDFHESESVPKISAKLLSELIFGSNGLEGGRVTPSRCKDVLVLFSNSWCGFCQRMELVVREVYRALMGYMRLIQSGSQHQETIDSMDEMSLKIPLVYLLDCTLNDCSHILKSIKKKEVYPELVLFPAENKDPVTYQGDIAVAPLITFLAEEGIIPQHLVGEEGIIWTPSEKGGSHEIVLTDRASERTDPYIWTKSHNPKNPSIGIGSILVATNKLNGVEPFEGSRILIVKADPDTRFIGLIVNKPLSWDSLSELEESSRILKEAPLSLGGPLMQQSLPFVALTRRAVKDQFVEVLPGIHFVEQLSVVREVDVLRSGNQSVMDYWFFLGYASWGWDQLFDEISRGAWTVTDDSARHLEWPKS